MLPDRTAHLMYWPGQERIVFGFVAFVATGMTTGLIWIAIPPCDPGMRSTSIAILAVLLFAIVKYARWVYSTTWPRAILKFLLHAFAYCAVISAIYLLARWRLG